MGNDHIHGPDFRFIRGLAFFQELPLDTVERMVSRMDKKTIRSGEYIFYQADPVNYLYILELGDVEIYKSDINGRKLTLWFIEAGDIFCLANMFASVSFANALARCDCLVYRIAKDKLLESLGENLQLSLQFITCLSSKMASYATLLEDFTFRDVKGRLARLLLRYIAQDEQHRPVCNLTHVEMASLLGTSREVVSRSLKFLRDEGVADANPQGRKQYLAILDVQRLQQICQQDGV
ncbi:MAG: Crp/Fnr family transcriptional regulator [Desulfocapsa sp.]|nr:Crp/Fnr family transcriptional regulator [Desulfocapsa sp.]